MKQPNGKIIARSVGYRVGKGAKEGEVVSDDELYQMFRRIFADELVSEAVHGYRRGRFVAAAKRQEQAWLLSEVQALHSKYTTPQR